MMKASFENQNSSVIDENSEPAKLQHRRHPLMHTGLGIALLAVIVAVIYFYVANEHTIYVSDYAGYQNITHSIVLEFRQSPLKALTAVARSMTAEYNALFTIPLLPWVLIFGESRMVFEIALGVMYVLPFCILLGAVAVELIRARPEVVFWTTVLLALLTPTVWVPTLRGYPDTGAAVIITLAIWIYLRDTRLEKIWQILSIGFLVTSSILFRRHFAYAALAFFAAIALQVLVQFVLNVQREPTLAWRDLRTRIIRIGLTALVAVLVLVTLGHPFLSRFLHIDYNALYADYTKPPISSLTWYIATYGWLVCSAAVLGFILGIRSHIVNLDAVIFISLFGSLTSLAWLLVARQTGEQYTLNFTAIIVLGLSILMWTVALRWKSAYQRISLAGSIAVLSANFVLGLTPLTMSNNSVLNSLFAMQEAPFTRGDQTQIMQLVDYLRNVAGNGEPIYVAASSTVMGKDTLVSAERMRYGWNDAKLNILYSPEIDSRDYYPLELLLKAKYVVFVDPFQYHLSPDKQRIVQVVYDTFKNDREFAQDFVKLPEHFTLDEGAAVNVYQRVRPTSIATAIKTLEYMESYVQTRPGGQPDWILLDQTNRSKIALNNDGSYSVTTQLFADGHMVSSDVLYIGTISNKGVLNGEIVFQDKQCAGIKIQLAEVNKSTEIMSAGEVSRQPNDSPDFSIPFEVHDPRFLLVTLESSSNPDSFEICPLNINHLRLAPR